MIVLNEWVAISNFQTAITKHANVHRKINSSDMQIKYLLCILDTDCIACIQFTKSTYKLCKDFDYSYEIKTIDVNLKKNKKQTNKQKTKNSDSLNKNHFSISVSVECSIELQFEIWRAIVHLLSWAFEFILLIARSYIFIS